MSLVLRPATAADAPLLRHWDAQPHVFAAKSDEDWQWEAELGRCEDWCARFIAERNGRPIGFVQILDAAREPTRYWGEVPEGTLAIDLWIGVESELGRGYGSEMMRQALQRCFDASGTQRVVVDPLAANTRAHRFYRRFGFRPLERRRLGTDECLVHALTRAAWEAVVQRFR
ncbi:MAG: GNAT family N-acetyltransferase [Pseudomonadota bacterium]|nr:MAG: GNAT family N-acetyltransferase [Pseudomonadota bacterium]